MEETNIQQNKQQTLEIDVVAVIKKTLKSPLSLCVFIILFGALGVVAALNTPKYYTASAVLAPEISGSTGLSGSLSDIASNFGIDLGSKGAGMDAIYPEIYPDVLASPDFLLKLLDVPVRLKDDDTPRTYEQHLKKDCKVGILDWPKVWLSEKLKSEKDKKDDKAVPSKDDAFKIPKKRSEMCEGLTKNVTCLVDKKTSVISLSMTDQDPLVAAIMIDTIQHRLQEYIINYRTRKTKTDCEYYKELYNDAKEKYQKVQKEYVDYCDANQELVLESFVVERDELEDKMQNAYNLMTQLQNQVQASEAKLREITPVFTVIAEPKMAYKASSLSRSAMVILFVIVGIFFDVIWVNAISPRFRKGKKRITTE